MPAFDLNTQEKVLEGLKNRTLELAQAAAERIGKKGIVRDLQPTDIGLSNEYFEVDLSAATAPGWVTYSTFTVPDNTYVGIGGIFNNTPCPIVSKVRIKAGSSYIREWEMEPWYASGTPFRVLQADEQVIFSENTEVTIEVYLKAPGVTNLGFYGYVGEPSGKTISKVSQVDP